MRKNNFFARFAGFASYATGTSYAFVIAVLIVIVWGVSGPVFKFSDTWQLVINTGTTIVTFLMVFLIQNSQNRDTKAMQIKLDEILSTMEGAHNSLLDLEELEEEVLEKYRQRYCKLAAEARKRVEAGEDDTESANVGAEEDDAASRIQNPRSAP